MGRLEDDFKISTANTCLVHQPKIKEIIFRSIFGHEKEVSAAELDRIYNDWRKSGVNIVDKDKPKFFYKYHVRGITYDEFFELIL